MPKQLNIFKSRKKANGWTATFRFLDAKRGEYFFDTEWNIHVGRIEPGKFTLTHAVDWQGSALRDALVEEQMKTALFKCLEPGDELIVQPRRWNMRGATVEQSHIIEVVGTHKDEHGNITVQYEQAKEHADA